MKRKNSFPSPLIILAIIFVILRMRGLRRGSLISSIIKLGFTVSTVLSIALIAVILFAVCLYKKDEKKKKGAAPKKDVKKDEAPKPDPQPKEPEPDLSDSEREALEKSRGVLNELQVKTARIKNDSVRAEAENVCGKIERILKTLRAQPDEIPKARQCLTYYLPTLESVISRYLTLEAAGTLDGGMTEKALKFLGQVGEAMDKQYTSLFDNEALDLSVDMEAMEIALKRDGLL